MKSRRTILLALALVAIAAAALSAVSLVRTSHLESSPALHNTAMVDPLDSQRVLDRADAAMTKLWSYDYRHLGAGKKRAATLGTPGFVQQYADIFGDIDRLAPKLQAVVTAKVLDAGLVSLEGDDATVVVFLDQRARKLATGQDSSAGARLKVRMTQVSGEWKVDSVDPF